MRARQTRCALWLLLWLVACGRAESCPIPPQTGDGWETAGPKAVGLEPAKLLGEVIRKSTGRPMDDFAADPFQAMG